MSNYIHSFTPEEQQRLIHQAEFLEPILHAGVNFSGCERVLEVGCGVGFEVGVFAIETEEARRDVLGEQLDGSIVALDGFVIAATLDGDTVFRAGEFVL